MKFYKIGSFNEEEVLKSNSTSRDFSPAFSQPIVPKYIENNIGLEESLLDFGAGKNAFHTQKLRDKGYNVVAHDFGLNFIFLGPSSGIYPGSPTSQDVNDNK